MGADEVRLDADDPLAQQLAEALTAGDVEGVKRLIDEQPGLAAARIVATGEAAGGRTLLHVFADYPGGRPRAREMVEMLVEAGADVNGRLAG